jgi:hypothetical protein
MFARALSTECRPCQRGDHYGCVGCACECDRDEDPWCEFLESLPEANITATTEDTG